MSTLQLLKQQFSSVRGKREDPFKAIALESLPHPVDALAEKIHHAGFRLCLKDITSDIGIASFGAALSKPTENYLPTVGFGAHPNAKVAAIRAITEVILNHNFTLTDVSQRTYTRPKGTFWWAHAPCYKNFSEVPSYEHDDVMDDVNLMISRLKACGISQVMAVDLTQSTLGIPVLRLIAPELECWCLTYFQGETRIGFRGRKLLT
jgi:ribosomal protein S12 methylthiotransferase accessory factor